MKGLSITMLALLTVMLSSCELAEGIFKAGVWAGLLIVAVVIFLILFIIGKMRK